MSFLIKIDVKNNVPDLASDEESRVEEGLKEIADHAYVTLLANTPVKTGNLRSSFQKSVSGLTASIRSTASYVMAVERGTRPHIILPRTARVLHFFIGKQEVFAKSVYHPGSRGRFFIRRTKETVIADIPKIMARYLGNIGKGGSA
jgi:hypothetical protein